MVVASLYQNSLLLLLPLPSVSSQLVYQQDWFSSSFSGLAFLSEKKLKTCVIRGSTAICCSPETYICANLLSKLLLPYKCIRSILDLSLNYKFVKNTRIPLARALSKQLAYLI